MKTIFKLAAACVCVGLVSPGGVEASCPSGPHPGRRIGPPPHRMHKEPPVCPNCGHKGPLACGKCGNPLPQPDRTKCHCQMQSHV